MPVSSSQGANCGAMMCYATVITLALSLLFIGESVSADQIDSNGREEFFQRAGAALDANEGRGGYNKICWNDAGAGISVGKLQWNQKRGDLPLYLRLCHKADAALFAQVFAKDAPKMLDEKFVRTKANFTDKNSLGRAMKNALAEPAFQQVQDKLIRQKLEWAIKVASELEHGNELMVMEIADISNQMGCGGARSALKRAGVKQLESPQKAVAALCKQTQSHRANGTKRDAYLARRFSISAAVSTAP